MMRILPSALLGVALFCTFPAIAKDQVSPDGVKVEKMSPLRNLISEAELEAAALAQYSQIKEEAAKQRALVPESDPQLQRLRAIAKKIIPQAERWNERAKTWPWEVNLFDSKEINAFAMPGGKIAFFSGLVNRLKLTDDEVAVVMGHEIAHALREHGRERAAKSALASAGSRIAGIGLSALFGIDPNLTTSAAGGVASLTMLKFSRDDEIEADLVGLDIVARAGYDPRAGITLWEKMGMINANAPPQWLSTHPAGKNRIAQMRRQLPKVMPLYAKVKETSVDALPPYQTNVKGIPAVK